MVGTPAHSGQYENSKQASASRGRTAVQRKDGSESGTKDPTHFGELVVAVVVLVVVVVVVAVVVVVVLTWATYRESTKPNRKQPHSVHAHLTSVSTSVKEQNIPHGKYHMGHELYTLSVLDTWFHVRNSKYPA